MTKRKYENLAVVVEEDMVKIPFRDGNYGTCTTPNAIRNIWEAAKEGNVTSLFLDELVKAMRQVADILFFLIYYLKQK